MKLSLVLISSYKSWQGNKDICTLLYFYKRLARKKNLRRVISFFFFPLPCLMRSVRGEPSTLPLRAERKVVWHGVMVCLLYADRGMFWGACTSCFHSDRPRALFTVSCPGNSSAGEA